jgi:hypothetical protein
MQVVDFESSEKLMAKYKILTPRTVFVKLEKEAQKAAKNFGFPVFLKIYGKNILHRTEIKGVGEAKDKSELGKMFSEMMKIKGTEGILIQEKVQGKELIIGMKRDAQFGVVIMAGIGGILAELISDFVLRVAPVSENEALKMLAELKGYPYLQGKRDKNPINFKEAAKVIAALSEMGLKEAEIKEITLNPVIVNEKKAVTVDFKLLK